MKHLGKRIFSRQQIDETLDRLAADIMRDFPEPKDLHIVVAMQGSLFFAADLLRRLNRPLTFDLVRASSYHGTYSSGTVLLDGLEHVDLAGRQVLLIDDVLDTGLTLSVLLQELYKRHPLQLRLCVLLRKSGNLKVPITPDYVGLDMGSEFIVGYGLDYKGLYRNLPEIYLFNQDREKIQ